MSSPENPLRPDAPPIELVPATVENWPSEQESSPEDPPWSFWDVVRIAAVAIVAIGLFSMFAIGIAMRGRAASAAVGADVVRNPRIVVPAQLAGYLVVIAFMAALLRSRGQAFWRTVRWNWPGTRWIGYAVVGVALAVAVQSASAFLPIPKSLPIDRYFRDTLGAYLMAFFGVTFAPLIEELFFRGFLYPVVARRLGVIAGVGITAALFALLHESQLAHAWAPLLLLFGVGVVLTAVRAKTGSVAASFVIHAGYNTTLFALLYVASDGFRHLERLT